jgi:hypothetical protein
MADLLASSEISEIESIFGLVGSLCYFANVAM